MDNQESLLDEVIVPESADEDAIEHTDLPETEIQLALEAVLFTVNEPISECVA